MVDLSRTRPETCLSDRALDMMMADELAAALRAQAERHLPGCAPCTKRFCELEAGRAAFSVEAPAFARVAAAVQPRRSRRKRWALGGAFTAVAAAALVLIWRAPLPRDGDAFRTKGAGDRLGFFVMRAGSVREGGPGEIVHPGDRLQVVYTASEPRYLAIFTRAANGAVTVAFPRDAGAAPRIDAGAHTALPYSLELDGAIGAETLHGLFCDSPLALEPLRRSLEQHGDRVSWPRGCRVDRISYRKQP